MEEPRWTLPPESMYEHVFTEAPSEAYFDYRLDTDDYVQRDEPIHDPTIAEDGVRSDGYYCTADSLDYERKKTLLCITGSIETGINYDVQTYGDILLLGPSWDLINDCSPSYYRSTRVKPTD